MPKILERRWGVFGWGVFASVLLHLSVGAVLFLELPHPTPKPEEETVSVDLVPPPEEKKPEEKKPEERAALKVPDEPKPEEKKPEQPPAAQKPANEQKPEEKKAEEKPQEPLKDEAKAEPPPKPVKEKPLEPPKPPEEKPPEQKPPEKPPEAKPEENKAEQPPKPDPAEQAKADEQPTGNEGKPQPIQPLRPVFEFGDKASGERKAEDGDASTETGKPAATPDAEKPSDDPVSAGKPDAEDKPPARPMPDDINLPQVAVADSHRENNGPPAEATGVVTTEITQAKPTDAAAQPDPTATAKPTADPLTKAKKLYSQNDTGGAVAKTAIDGMPRGMRVAELCTTELREQLRHSPQGYRPELLPSYRLSQGTVLDVKRGAFRASSRWYDMSFRCEVDAEATKIVSFAYDVGEAIPKSQWRSRGLPSF